MSKIKVVLCPVDRPPYVTNISNTLENLRKIVGGYIEICSFTIEACVVINENGRNEGLEENPCFAGLVGPVIVSGIKGEELTGLPDVLAKKFYRLIKESYQKHVAHVAQGLQKGDASGCSSSKTGI